MATSSPSQQHSLEQPLGILDSKGLEFIGNYRAIAAKLKKRFMKKPNVREASEDYGKIANKLKNEENSEYAALCFAAMAKCDQLIGDNGSEAESWANAGRQFILAEERLQDSKNASYTDMLEAGVQCFLLAIHVLESQGDNLLAASFALEAGQRLTKCGWYSQAAVFLQRAIDLQHQTLDWRLDTMKQLASCRLKLREYSTVLIILTQITAECEERAGPFQKLLHECQISQLLLLLLLKPNYRHLSQQLVNVLDKFSKTPSIGNLSEEKLLLHTLLISANDNDYQSLLAAGVRLRQFLTADQKQLLHIVMEEYSLHHSLH